MALPSFMIAQGQDPQPQAIQSGPPAEWSPSEYMGPSQLPVAVVSIACGSVIVLLIAYVAYLQRSCWKSMVDEGRKKLRRLTGRKPLPIFQDDLIERLDALEKALRQDVTPANTLVATRISCETISRISLRSGDSSSTTSTRGKKLSRSLSFRSSPAFPLSTNPSTANAIMSEKSFYSQTGNSFNLLSSPLPIIQIHPVESSKSVYSSFEQTTRPRSLSAPSSHARRYGQLGDHDEEEGIPSRFILPDEPQPSFSSMLTRFTMNTLGEDLEVDSLSEASPTWGSPLLSPRAREEDRLWEESPCDSSIHTPILPPPSTPPTPTFTLSFEQLRERLDVVRRSAIFSAGSIHTTLDDIHEDIKRSYDVFLSMLDDGLFDSPENSPHMEHLKRVDPAIFRDSTSAADVEQREFERGMDEQGAKELNTRFISMLIEDLEHHTSKTNNSSRDLGHMSLPPRAQNPVTSQLENEDIAIVCLQGLGPSPCTASPNSSMGSSYPSPTTIFSSTRSFSTGLNASPFTPHATRSPNTPTVQRSPQQIGRSSIISANRYSMIISRPVRGDLHLRKFDFDPRLDPGVFGFGRAAAWNPSGASGSRVPGRRQSTASWSSQGSIFDRNSGASQGPFTAAPPTHFTPSSRVEHSKSLPNIDRHGRSRSILPPSPVLPPGLGPASPRLEIVHSQQHTEDKPTEKRRPIVGGLTSRLSLESLGQFRGTALSPVSRLSNRYAEGPGSGAGLD